MSLRRTVLAVSLIVLPLLVGAAAAPAARAPEKGTLKAPTDLRITASSATSIALAWNGGANGSSNWWYCVQRDGLGCIRVAPPRTTISFSRLWPATTFNYSVVAVDSTGKRSAPSNTVTYTTPPDTTPPTAPALSATGLLPTRISVAWTQSTDDVSQVWYALFLDGSPYSTDQLGFRGSTVLDLAAQSTHVLKVTARDFFGNTTESNIVTVTTPATSDRTPPTIPTNLRLSPESSVPEIWLAWDQSTDDTDSQAQIMYEIFLNGTLADRAIGYVETVTYCVGEGPNTIAVRAVDSSGNASGFSNEIAFC